MSLSLYKAVGSHRGRFHLSEPVESDSLAWDGRVQPPSREQAPPALKAQYMDSGLREEKGADKELSCSSIISSHVDYVAISDQQIPVQT